MVSEGLPLALFEIRHPIVGVLELLREQRLLATETVPSMPAGRCYCSSTSCAGAGTAGSSVKRPNIS